MSEIRHRLRERDIRRNSSPDVSPVRWYGTALSLALRVLRSALRQSAEHTLTFAVPADLAMGRVTAEITVNASAHLVYSPVSPLDFVLPPANTSPLTIAKANRPVRKLPKWRKARENVLPQALRSPRMADTWTFKPTQYRLQGGTGSPEVTIRHLVLGEDLSFEHMRLLGIGRIEDLKGIALFFTESADYRKFPRRVKTCTEVQDRRGIGEWTGMEYPSRRKADRGTVVMRDGVSAVRGFLMSDGKVQDASRPSCKPLGRQIGPEVIDAEAPLPANVLAAGIEAPIGRLVHAAGFRQLPKRGK